jgi:methylglutaconyl-CoA hydratase
MAHSNTNHYETIRVEDDGSVRTITLHRPERRNALTQEMIRELTKVLVQTAESHVLRVLILTGAGDGFCSGLDLSELQKIASQSEDEQRSDSWFLANLFRLIYDCPKPTIAAVQGAAVAGGMGLATVCDFTLASADARFGYPEVKIGFIPAIVSAFLKRQIGDKQLRDLLLTGRLLDAKEAHHLGLVTRVVEDQPVLEAAATLAATLLKNSPASLAATKRLLHAQYQAELDRDLELAAEANAVIRKTPDFAEGLAAFLEKRKPVWPRT